MRTVAIIPARMASTRFPGKPLADILGLPMIEHVRRRVALSPDIDEVVVATCDREIADVVERAGGRAVMTADTHERCTDRIAEAAATLQADVIVNVQGDEPFVRPEMFGPLLRPLADDPELLCTNLMAEIRDEREFQSSDVVKAVFDLRHNAIYFSREPIPSARKAGGVKYKKFKQLGIVAFRMDFLGRFAVLPPTPLEALESVDMLRALEHGYRVRMVETPSEVVGVDTPEDLRRAVQLMQRDDIFNSYRQKGQSSEQE